jgi:hypothetical protein
MKLTLFIDAARLLPLISTIFVTACAAPSAPLRAGDGGLTPAQIDRVGNRIWQNECAGTVSGLTSWNTGEDFASLGIGHFIWYPAGRRGPFEESFPALVGYLEQRGVKMPSWTKGACAWNSKAIFDADKNGPRQKELRAILAGCVRQQTEFIMLRLQRAVSGMVQAGGNRVAQNHAALSQSAEGMFAMIDYVNFKGEGLKASERYQGQGWGLAQVLGEMRNGSVAEFAEAAKRVLSRRVALSPPDRGEKRWLAGWHSRCEAYKRPL